MLDRDEPNNRKGAVYKIICSDCQASYIGETGRNLEVSHNLFSSAGGLIRIHASFGGHWAKAKEGARLKA